VKVKDGNSGTAGFGAAPIAAGEHRAIMFSSVSRRYPPLMLHCSNAV